MKKIYALFMTLCLIISATAAPLAGTVKGSYPLNTKVVTSAKQLSLDATMQKAPAATQGLQYDATEGELIRYYNESDALSIDTTYASEGQLSIRIVASDNSDLLSLVLFAEDTVPGTIIPEGTYPISSDGAAGTAYASPGVQNGSVYPSFYGMLNSKGQVLTPLYFLESGNVVVEAVNGNLKISINAANSNNVPMTIVYEVGGKSEKVEVKGPLKYDATETDGALDVTYGADATVELTNGNGYSILTVASPDATNEVDLAFFYDAADPETVIPVGTYTIDDSYTPGTVLASAGINNQGQVSLSFYANLDEEGYLVTPIYFLVSGTVEVTNVDGNLKVEVNAVNSNDVPIHIVYDATPAEPEIEWEEMDLEITNLTTEVMEVEGKKYLQLNGRNDMMDADVYLFLNDYADVDDDYEVNAESSYMTFGGMELTVLEGVMTQTSETDKGTIYTGTVYASVTDEEEGGTMYVKFALTMYAAPATVLELTDAIVAINEDLGTLTFNVPTGEGEGYFVELSGYTAPGVHEGPQICLFETPEVVAYTNYAETSVADGVITLKGEFVSPMGPKFDVTISGKLPVVEEPEVEKPEPTYTENNLNPYAFGLESKLSDDKTTLTVTYRLNNSNATSVNVLVYNGEDIVASIPGTTTIGKNTVEVATGNLPAGVELKWAVEVNGTSVEVPTQETKMYNLYCPHGLAIDTDPESENFGRILVAEAMQAVPASGYVTSGKGAGLYVFNPSFTTDSTVYTGGNDFTRILASNGYQPWRVKISEDGRIFVSSLDLNGVVVWEVSKDLQTWTPVIAGTNDATDYNIYDAEGNFIAGPNCSMDVIGKGEDLKLLLYSTNNKGIAFNQSGYRLDEYALGTATTWTGTPKNIINGGKFGVVHTNVEFIYDGEGGYWFGGSRAGNAGQPNLVHINAAGEQDYYTEDASLYGGDGVLLHNGMLFKGKARTSGTVGNFGVWTIGKDADGKVTLTEKWAVVADGIGRNLNEFAVDYAENLYIVGNSGEKIIAYALPYSGQVETPAAAKYAFQLPEPLKMAGVVKRAVQNGDEVIVLTHEEDGAAHIYQVINGKALAELSQEGVIAVDPENAGDLLAISDIAVTEDGKLVATNYMVTQSDDTRVDAGYKRGETRIYIWNDLAGDPSILFTSKMSSNWFRSKQGLTMAVKGTSDNMEIFMTGIHATSAWARVSSYRVIDGVYVEPEVNHNDHYYFYDVNDAIALETTVGTQYELNASPLGEMNWVLDAELINPTEIVEPETNNVEITTSVALTEDLGKKYNGATYVTVGEQVLMVTPFATPDGKLNSVMILDITAGFDAPKYVDQLILDEAVEATAAATAVEVVEGDEATALLITLVADATIYSLEATLAKGGNWEVYEDEITNMAFDLDNLIITGGPSTAYQVQVVLALGDSNPLTGEWQVKSESSVSIMGTEATFVEGTVFEVDAFAPSAKAIVRCEWNGQNIELHLTMSAAPMEATVVIVENAVVEVEKFIIFGDDYDYSLKMTGVWHNEEDGLDYPVLVEVPVYYPEATEPSEITSTVTVGGWEDDDPWLGFGEGTLTVTTVDGVVTAAGIVQNPQAGVAIDITISGKLETTALENLQVTVKPVKMIQNGQLIIKKGDVQYNANGAVIK